MLLLGRELQQMSQNLKKDNDSDNQNKSLLHVIISNVKFIANHSHFFLLQDAFSLLAYNDPWNSPVGWQLNPKEREPVSRALNSAILCKSSFSILNGLN